MNWDKSKEKHWSFQDLQVAASGATARREKARTNAPCAPWIRFISLRSLARINDQAARPASSTLNPPTRVSGSTHEISDAVLRSLFHPGDAQGARHQQRLHFSTASHLRVRWLKPLAQ